MHKIGLCCLFALARVVAFCGILLLCMWQLLEGKIVFSLTVMGENMREESFFFSYDFKEMSSNHKYDVKLYPCFQKSCVLSFC